ncbi:MAG: prepilin-type N-terminal cleavage/methylation domain-containing protein [Actinobacteria bacterium]|nr:prepilin-type N-terminal cleavage/methylation domain-containing protein [Actinomycetota bacterium]
MGYMHKIETLNKDDGFTFLELMIVVGIIGVLVTIAVLSFAFSISASKKTACSANIKTIRKQLHTYYTSYREYPPSLQDMVPEYIDSEKCLSCPDSGEAYVYDDETGEVYCPYHDGE